MLSVRILCFLSTSPSIFPFQVSRLSPNNVFREGVKLAKREGFHPDVVDKYVHSLIEKHLGPDVARSKGIASKKHRYSAYNRRLSRKRKPDDEDTGVNGQNDYSDLDIDQNSLSELRRLNRTIEDRVRPPKPNRPPEVPMLRVT